MQDGRRNLKRGQFAVEYEREGGLSKKNSSVSRDGFRKISGAEKAWSHATTLREQWSAQVAMIPLELATWIGECFRRSFEAQGFGDQPGATKGEG